MIRTTGLYLTSILIVSSLTLTSSALAKEKKEKPKPTAVYSMAILPLAGSDDSTPSEITVTIDRFTTPDERTNLLSILEQKGQSAALTAAQKAPVGRLGRPGDLATDILYAFQQPSPEGNRIIIATLRFNVYPDAVLNVDPMKEPFTLAWFVPSADGKGKGKIYGAAALNMKKDGTVDVSAYPPGTADLAFVKLR